MNRLPRALDVVVISALVALSGIPAAAQSQHAGKSFAHEKGGSTFGYYRPTSKANFGYFQFVLMQMDRPPKFDAFEAKGKVSKDGPVMLVFGVRAKSGELDETADYLHVAPTGYYVGKDWVRFTGEHPMLGEVRFEGRGDLDKVRAQNKEDEAEGSPGWIDGVILTGKLTVGGKTFDNLSFEWDAGD